MAIPHQGRVTVSGTNYDGSGSFKFLLFTDPDADHASGNETALWSNAATSPAGMTEPVSTVSILVTKGLYGTWLGDTTVPGMAALPASIEPPAGEKLYLRIWFDDGINGSQQLLPDQPVGAVPFALHANGVIAGAITSAAIALGAVTTDKLDSAAVTQDKLAPGAATELGTPGDPGSELIAARTEGTVAVGINAASAPLSATSSLVPLDTIATVGGGREIVVRGNFAYVGTDDFGGSTAGGLEVFDISNPNSIVARGTNDLPVDPTGIGLVGDYAVITDDVTDTLSVYDISDPDNITFVTSTGGLNNPQDLAVSGNFVFVLNGPPTPELIAFEILVDGSIVQKDSDSTNMAAPSAIAIQGDHAYVVNNSFSTTNLQIFGISNPTNLSPKGTLQLSFPRDIEVSGDFAYVVDGSAQGLTVVNVSDPLNPALAGNFDINDELIDPLRLAVDGDRLYVAGIGDGCFVLDISSPDSPVLRDYTYENLSSSGALTVAGGTVYGTNLSDVTLVSFATQPSLRSLGSLDVTGTGSFDKVSLSDALIFSDGTIQRTAASDQKLSLNTSSNILTIFPNGNNVSLSKYTQTLGLSGDSLTLSNGGGSVGLNKYLLEDGSEPVTGNLTVDGDLAVSGTVTATAHKFPSAQSFTYQVPGNTMMPNSETEEFFRSTLGFIRQDGTNTILNLIAPVHLPDGAVVTAVDGFFYDNTINNFDSINLRFRRRDAFSLTAENVAARDYVPGSVVGNIISQITVTIEASRATVDNDLYHYWVNVELTAPTPHVDLRFYGFRIVYTLDTLAP